MSASLPISALNTYGNLLSKYDCPFNYYLAKPINHIIYNRNHEQANLIAKDVAALVEDLEYLKRYYHEKNAQGKNEIHDRMALLINFYATANMLQYEYPNMVITQTQELFKKRRKKINQLNKRQDQEQDDSSSSSNGSRPAQKCIDKEQLHCQQQFLDDLQWSDIINCYIPTQKEPSPHEELEFDEEFSIYDQQPKRTDSFFSKINKLTSQLAFEMNFDTQQNQKEVSHLILDFDDLDREKIVYQYTKLTNKENIPLHSPKLQGFKHSIQSLNDKKPLSSSITIDTLRQSNFNDRAGQASQTRQSMIGSRDERNKQINLVKRSSLLQSSKKTFVFNEDMIINENQCEESPLHQPSSQFNLHPHEQKGRVFPVQSKKFLQMKQSEILYNDYFIKEKYQKNHHDCKTQLNRLKENPVELNQILKLQTSYERHLNPPMIKQSSTVFSNHPQPQQRPELPFYLKRVKSHDEIKPMPPDDSPFYKTKKK